MEDTQNKELESSIINKINEFSQEIFNTLGSGYKEHVYVSAMCIHLREQNYLFGNEVIVPIEYKGIQLGYERADIIIYEPIKCIIEFKAQTQSLSKKEITQLKKYQNNLKINCGILINFGNNNNKLEFQNINASDEKKTISID